MRVVGRHAVERRERELAAAAFEEAHRMAEQAVTDRKLRELTAADKVAASYMYIADGFEHMSNLQQLGANTNE